MMFLLVSAFLCVVTRAKAWKMKRLKKWCYGAVYSSESDSWHSFSVLHILPNVSLLFTETILLEKTFIKTQQLFSFKEPIHCSRRRWGNGGGVMTKFVAFQYRELIKFRSATLPLQVFLTDYLHRHFTVGTKKYTKNK